MGYNYCLFKKPNEKIEVIKYKELNELDLIDMLVERRKKYIKFDSISDFLIKNTKINSEVEFYEDVNSNEKLCKYLDSLNINSQIKQYELILFLYFDVLSIENKLKYTQLKFESNIERYMNLINDIVDDKFKENDKIQYYYGLLDREKLLSNKIIKSFPEIIKSITENEPHEKILNQINNELNIRVNSKITLKNKEMFFKGLIDIYLEKFSIDKNYIYFRDNLLKIKDVIFEFINQIKNNNESNINEKFLLLLFFSPIICEDTNPFVEMFEENIEYKPNFLINKYKNKLTIKNKNQQILLEFENAEAINIRSVAKNYNIFSNMKNPYISPYLIYKCIKPQFFQDYNFYKHEKIIYEFNFKLLKKILRSKTIKTLLDFLNPELNNMNIFKKDEIIEQIFDSIIFTPFKLLEPYGMTMKPFLIIFINGLPPEQKVIDEIGLLNSCSSFEIIGIHEICTHWLSAFVSFKSKNNLLYHSISYKNFPDDSLKKQYEEKELLNLDGGDLIELILFSRVMNEANVKEILFILCENSYKDDYITFKNKFKNLKKISIEILYNLVIQDKELKSFLDFLGINLQKLQFIEKEYFGLKYKRSGEIKRCRKGNSLKYKH